jgi:hypothetical protein
MLSYNRGKRRERERVRERGEVEEIGENKVEAIYFNSFYSKAGLAYICTRPLTARLLVHHYH